MKNMKKFLIIILGSSVLISSLSVAYYFIIYLPRKEENYQTEFKRMHREIINTQNSIENINNSLNTNNTDNRLENIEYSIQKQERDRQMQTDCESGGGNYQGSGVCMYR